MPVWVHELLIAPLAFALAYGQVRRALGARRAAIELGALVIYGLALERSAMWLFASHDYRSAWLIAPAGVPLAIALTWAALIVSALGLGARLGFRTPLARALAAALVATALDLLIEPVAVRGGLWRWTPPGAWLGVPLGNFVGWAIVVGAYGWGTERFARDASTGRQVLRRGLLALASIALLLGVGLLWTSAGCERLFDGGRGLVVGYGVWLATAVVALTARLRAREATCHSSARAVAASGGAPGLVFALVGATFAFDAALLGRPELWPATVVALTTLASVLLSGRAS